mgnify:FL=1
MNRFPFQNQELLDDIISIGGTTSKSNHRIQALKILRNVCFNQGNKHRMLCSGPFLNLLLDTLNSEFKREEVEQVIYAIWALACNSQKNKVILKSAGFDVKLESAKRNMSSFDGDAKTNDLIDVVVEIFKNK